MAGSVSLGRDTARTRSGTRTAPRRRRPSSLRDVPGPGCGRCRTGGRSPPDRGGARAAAMYTVIGTAKLNDVDPQAWLADVLGRIADTPQTRLHELLPWNWAPERKLDQAA